MFAETLIIPKEIVEAAKAKAAAKKRPRKRAKAAPRRTTGAKAQAR